MGGYRIRVHKTYRHFAEELEAFFRVIENNSTVSRRTQLGFVTAESQHAEELARARVKSA